MKASEMANEELAECIESARLAPAKYVREDELNFHREAIREAAARLRNLGEIGEEVGLEATREKSSRVGNSAKMRKALSDACYAMFNFLKTQNGGYGEMEKALDKAKAALAVPPRNCDRPECATTKSAQDVWRKEDGGKTAYYEWLLAASTKGAKEGDSK